MVAKLALSVLFDWAQMQLKLAKPTGTVIEGKRMVQVE